jgi:outer membrane receptor for ferrienterochelin and colicins
MGKSDIGTPTAAEPLGTRSAMTQTRRVGSITHIGDWGFATSNSYLQYEDARHLEGEKRIRNTVGQSIWQVPLPANNLTLGGYYRHEDMTDLTSNGLAGSTRTGATRTSWALFAENELSILKSLRLTGGIRMDNDEQYGVHWTPRAYLVWSVTGRVTLKGGYSQGSARPACARRWSTGGRRAGAERSMATPTSRPRPRARSRLLRSTRAGDPGQPVGL